LSFGPIAACAPPPANASAALDARKLRREIPGIVTSLKLLLVAMIVGVLSLMSKALLKFAHAVAIAEQVGKRLGGPAGPEMQALSAPPAP
jgi:hypothetical protein